MILKKNDKIAKCELKHVQSIINTNPKWLFIYFFHYLPIIILTYIKIKKEVISYPENNPFTITLKPLYKALYHRH